MGDVKICHADCPPPNKNTIFISQKLCLPFSCLDLLTLNFCSDLYNWVQSFCCWKKSHWRFGMQIVCCPVFCSHLTLFMCTMLRLKCLQYSTQFCVHAISGPVCLGGMQVMPIEVIVYTEHSFESVHRPTFFDVCTGFIKNFRSSFLKTVLGSTIDLSNILEQIQLLNSVDLRKFIEIRFNRLKTRVTKINS